MTQAQHQLPQHALFQLRYAFKTSLFAIEESKEDMLFKFKYRFPFKKRQF